MGLYRLLECESDMTTRLDQSNIILRGNCEEAASALLKGTLVLCLSEPLRIQAVRLRFTGEKRIGLARSTFARNRDGIQY